MDAPTTPIWNPASQIWSLSVKCPHCKNRVRHGGGDDPLHVLLGSRACNGCGKAINLVEISK